MRNFTRCGFGVFNVFWRHVVHVCTTQQNAHIILCTTIFLASLTRTLRLWAHSSLSRMVLHNLWIEHHERKNIQQTLRVSRVDCFRSLLLAHINKTILMIKSSFYLDYTLFIYYFKILFTLNTVAKYQDAGCLNFNSNKILNIWVIEEFCLHHLFIRLGGH